MKCFGVELSKNVKTKELSKIDSQDIIISYVTSFVMTFPTFLSRKTFVQCSISRTPCALHRKNVKVALASCHI